MSARSTPTCVNPSSDSRTWYAVTVVDQDTRGMSTPYDLCGGKLPVQFLVAAQVKKRSVCNESERLNIPAIAMVACKFGCDALYEEGNINIDEDGVIVVSSFAPSREQSPGT